MPYLDTSKMTGLQKVLTILFILTIVLSCVSLVWIQIEKPGKVTKRCELINQFMQDHNFTFNNTTANLSLFRPACPSTTNPPMSPGLEATINLSYIVGAIFIVFGVYTYLSRKKEEPPEQPKI